MRRPDRAVRRASTCATGSRNRCRTSTALRSGAASPARHSFQSAGRSRIDRALSVRTPSSVYLSPPWRIPWAATDWPVPRASRSTSAAYHASADEFHRASHRPATPPPMIRASSEMEGVGFHVAAGCQIVFISTNGSIVHGCAHASASSHSASVYLAMWTRFTLSAAPERRMRASRARRFAALIAFHFTMGGEVLDEFRRDGR